MIRKLLMCCALWIPVSHPVLAGPRALAIQGGGGSWYSDAFKSSYIYGGGLLISPGIDWLEFTATYEIAKMHLAPSDPYYSELQGDKMKVFVAGVTFPAQIKVWGGTSYLYPLFAYTNTELNSERAHGFAIGGGMELRFAHGILGLRFEVRDMVYLKIPLSGGVKTENQSDLHFLLKLVITIVPL